MNLNEINVNELQLTTRCNGKCPLCLRQKVSFKIEDMKLETVKRLYPYRSISFVGPLGDATLHPELDEIIEIVKNKGSRINMLTNASTHNPKWWTNLAKKMRGCGNDGEKHLVLFSLDGLKNTHEFYRGSNVKFENVINNIKAFAGAGGEAHCVTLIFKHNEHEIDEIENLVYDIGCKSHRVKVSWYYDSVFEKPTKWNVKTRTEISNERGNLNHNFICDFFHLGNVAIDMNGKIHPCCRFSQQSIKKEILNTKSFIQYAKSYKRLHDLEYAVTSPYFNYIKDHFSDIFWCKKYCIGSNFGHCYEQYEWTNEIWESVKGFDDNEIFHATNTNQNKCKKWIIKELNRIHNIEIRPNRCAQFLQKKPKNIIIVCGWYAIIANYLFRFADFDIGKITSIDKNSKYKKPAEMINKQYGDRFTATTDDIFSLKYDKNQMVINTSCEHIDLRKWLDLIPQGTLLVLQSTDMDNKEHINCVDDIEEFKRQVNLSILYEGERAINWGRNKRFMLIGIK